MSRVNSESLEFHLLGYPIPSRGVVPVRRQPAFTIVAETAVVLPDRESNLKVP